MTVSELEQYTKASAGGAESWDVPHECEDAVLDLIADLREAVSRLEQIDENTTDPSARECARIGLSRLRLKP